ncbi:site-specific integrase [Gluconobacter sp. LMG 1745]|uniref:Site-specific integrase n=3 Tax=Gluconobacter TaxID=441 RepID=A0ABR9YYU7_9PROT|nr:site-specific integrase [Gluconobacter cadivus]
MQQHGFKTKDDAYCALLDKYEDMLATQETIRKNDVSSAEMAGQIKYYKSTMQHAHDVRALSAGIEKIIAVALDSQNHMTAMTRKLIQAANINSAEKKVLENEIKRLHETLLSTFTQALNSRGRTNETSAPASSETETKPRSAAATPKARPATLLTEALDRFLNSKPAKSLETQRDTSRTVALFIEAFGDRSIREIDGKVAGDFRDVLFSLPASHGKTKNLSLQEEIDRAASQDVPTLSAKTVKNHFMRLSSLWNDLLRRDMVEKNPWGNWDFNLTKKTSRRAWTAEEMSKLLQTPWPVCSIPADTFKGITMIAAYSGMRLGEICNLRNEDIQTIDGVQCFRICAHPDDNWSPKTEAGERLVPIHSALLGWGILNFRKTGEKYLFSDLKNSQDGNRGADFSRAFSRYKTMMELPPAVTFHGFRHTVSTLLRNQNSDIRELWIDALLGHEASHKSQGATTYLSGIEMQNLKRTVEAIQYPSFVFPKFDVS